MLTRFFALSSAVAVLLAASQVDAHGHLVEPKAEFGDNKGMMSSFAGRIPDPNTLYPGSNFPASGTKGNYQEFMKHFKNGTQSLKEIIDANNKPLTGATKECGFSVLGSPQAAPATMLWGKNEGKSSSEGFRPTHLGACETYCDDTLVQKNDECATAYNQPDNKGQAKVPIEVSKCAGAKQLTFYWLSTQAKDEGGFQVYVNCIALSGASSGGSSAGSSSTPSAGDADADAGDDNGNAAPATVKPSSAAGDDTEGSDSGSDSVNVPTSKTPKTKKPKKTKQPKVKKTKKPKKEKKDDKSNSSADSDADAGSLADDVDCN